MIKKVLSKGIIAIAVIAVIIVIASSGILAKNGGVFAKKGQPGTITEGLDLAGVATYKSADDAVISYFDYMSHEDKRILADANNYVYCMDPGNDPDDLWHNYIGNDNETSDEIINAWRQGIKEFSHNSVIVAENQTAFVKSLFGENAWDNVSYEFEPWTAVMDTYDAYFVVQSGEEISQEEYESIQRQFWENVAEKEGVTYDDLFQSSDPAKFREDIRADIVSAYVDECPVKMGVLSPNTAYKVCLMFNGRDSADEYGDFKFYVEGSEDSWKIISGLQWEYIGPEMYIRIDENGNPTFVSDDKQ